MLGGALWMWKRKEKQGAGGGGCWRCGVGLQIVCQCVVRCRRGHESTLIFVHRWCAFRSIAGSWSKVADVFAIFFRQCTAVCVFCSPSSASMLPRRTRHLQAVAAARSEASSSRANLKYTLSYTMESTTTAVCSQARLSGLHAAPLSVSRQHAVACSRH